jgi:predicted nucleic acid-binding protein
MASELGTEWLTVAPSDDIRQRAVDLVGRYDLRAADSFQLAAAFQWCLGKPRGEVFLTADQRLRQAAQLSGFDAKTV